MAIGADPMGKKPQSISRDTLTAIEAQKIGSGMPVTTQGVGGDARAMLLRFHANFPFVGIMPFPAASIIVRFPDVLPIDVTLPDATLWVALSGIGNVCIGAPGIGPDVAALAAGVNEGGFILPQGVLVPIFTFGKRSLTVRAELDDVLSILCYQQVETGLGQAPQLGI